MAQKIWMITGASRGFGAEISKAVLAAGDRLIATARNIQRMEHLGTPENLFTVALDVTDEPRVKEAVDTALEHFGRIDVLVNNAASDCLERSKRAARRKWNVFSVPMSLVC